MPAVSRHPGPDATQVYLPVYRMLSNNTRFANLAHRTNELWTPEGPFLTEAEVVDDALTAAADGMAELETVALVRFRQHPDLHPGAPQAHAVEDVTARIAGLLRLEIETWEDLAGAGFPWVPRCVLQLTAYEDRDWRGEMRAETLASYEADLRSDRIREESLR